MDVARLKHNRFSVKGDYVHMLTNEYFKINFVF